MDLMAAADELYSLHPEEFVQRRNELAAEVKGENKALAADIKKLAKPTTAAWVVNMLVRHESDQVEQVLELGAALREAQVSMAGEELRQLGRRRRQLTAAVTRQAQGLARGLGQKVAEPVAAQVENTLHAAMADEDAAKAVRTGMLVKPLAISGTEVADVAESVAMPSAIGASAVRRPTARRAPARETVAEAPKPELTVVPDNSRAIKEAEADLTEAETELASAERLLAKAQRRVEKREAKGLQLQAELDELRRRLAEVVQRVDVNEDELSDAEDERDSQEELVELARAAVDRARATLEELR